MLFSSPAYVFVFLPLVFAGFFLLGAYRSATAAKLWLVLASLFFYAYWNPLYLVLIGASIVCNYTAANYLVSLEKKRVRLRKGILLAGILFNLGLLAYFKYADFFLENMAALFDMQLQSLGLVLPLAISFFTFQQIAFQVDCYLGKAGESDFLNYCLFVSFFPQLIAGPIVHHKQMMPQFAALKTMSVSSKNILAGLVIFGIGLFKKLVIADSFGVWADAGYGTVSQLSSIEAWGTSLSYTFQLYYDFSGYSDMAIGAALLFNIHLPANFNSPYKATNIQDFWRRWHMTLSSWMRDYVYIPLGGNKGSEARVMTNVLLTFVLGGLWHGAGWGFVLWGFLHGLALAIFRLWSYLNIKLVRPLAWALTFLFVHFSWTFFRAENTEDATQMILRMLLFNHRSYAADANSSVFDAFWLQLNNLLATQAILLFAVPVMLFTLTCRNSMQIRDDLLEQNLGSPQLLRYAVAGGFALVFLSTTSSQVFLYFNF